jgi:hypothetical protein
MKSLKAEYETEEIKSYMEKYEIGLKETMQWVCAKCVEEPEVVGKLVQVWWHDDKQFYAGIVDAFEASSGRHKVKYIDGVWEFVDLRAEPVLIAFPSKESKTAGDDNDDDRLSSKSSKKRVRDSVEIDVAPSTKQIDKEEVSDIEGVVYQGEIIATMSIKVIEEHLRELDIKPLTSDGSRLVKKDMVEALSKHVLESKDSKKSKKTPVVCEDIDESKYEGMKCGAELISVMNADTLRESLQNFLIPLVYNGKKANVKEMKWALYKFLSTLREYFYEGEVISEMDFATLTQHVKALQDQPKSKRSKSDMVAILNQLAQGTAESTILEGKALSEYTRDNLRKFTSEYKLPNCVVREDFILALANRINKNSSKQLIFS